MTTPVPAELKVETYTRRPFEIKAVQVTPKNIELVAAWCGGQVRTSDLSKKGGREGTAKYIKVNVKNPLNDKQTRAQYGDFVLEAGSGFKIYTPKAFAGSFEKVAKHMVETLDRMEHNAEEAAKIEFEDIPGTSRSAFVSPAS